MDHHYKEHPTPTGRLVDGQLVPAPESLDADVTAWLALPPESGDVQIWEGLAGRRATSGDRVEIRAVPLFAYDVNYGDEVAVAASTEGPLVATGITRDAGNHTFRVWLEHGDRNILQRVVTEFGQLGCLIEGYSAKLLGLSCSQNEAQAVTNALRTGAQEGRFVYETGRTRRPRSSAQHESAE